MATSIRAASTSIVISEFRTRGAAGGNDEFIEIHNISNAAVNIGGWKIRGSNSAGTVGDRATILAGVSIGPGCFYLLTNSASGGYSGAVPGNQTYATGVTDDGGIAITMPDNTIIDAVGMSAGSAFKEGTTLTQTTSNLDRGIERKPGGAAGHKTDTDNNAADFQAITPGNPQNAQSACIQYGGDAAPAVTSTVPVANATNVAVTSAITINFSESVSATASAFSLTCGSATQSFTQSGSPASAFTLTPDAALPFNSHCAVVVTAAQITDTDPNDPPNEMTANYSFAFDTEPAADTAPGVVSTNPANGALDVALGSNIVINFSEQVTATTSAFTVNCGTGDLAFGQTSGASATFTLDPNVNLPAGQVCSVTVSASQVSDIDNRDPAHPLNDYGFSFTTATPVATNVLINELDADTPGSPQDLAEFVELYDGGVGSTSLTGLSVVFYDGGTHAAYQAFDLDGYTTNAQGYFTLGNPGVNGVDLEFGPGEFGTLQNGADAVALVIGNAANYPPGTPISTANVVDAIAYDTDDADDAQLRALLNSGQPQINENGGGNGPNDSIGRCTDGSGGARNTFTYRNTVPSPDGPNNCPPPVDSPIVISQLYGGGGNGGATFENDFVELFNKSNATVDITGWSLQYAAAAGSGWDFNKTPLGGPIKPGEYYLVKLASNGDEGEPVPAPNASGLINMAGANGKIALVGTGDSLVGDCPLGNPNLRDLVGYGTTASCGEGMTKAPTLTNGTAAFRRNDGNTDTNDNAADFLAGAPAPRRTAEIVELRPFLLSADPTTNGTNVPKDPTIALQFSEPVETVGDNWFDLTCAQSGTHNSYSRSGSSSFIDLTINDPLTPGESCTITILQTGVRDADTDDETPATDFLPWNYQWSFTVSSATTPPPYEPEVHLTFGNPSNATPDLSDYDNYLMSKPEYALSYNRDLGRPNWVSWHLSNDWYGTLARVDTFRADPQIPPDAPWYRVQGFDFANSGFDRGHMVPNADRDKATAIPNNQATYLMTNMIAQAPNNNQGPWAAMEAELRTIADGASTQPPTPQELYIVAGPAGVGGTGSSSTNNGYATTIAGGHVTVPAFTWKVALVLPKGDNDLSRVSCTTRSIAVILPNEQTVNSDWHSYLTTVDAVESLTGYDFFSNLPPDVQYCVEHFVDGETRVPDVTAPVIQCASPDGNWHNDNVSLTCTATDAGSGLANAADGSFTSMTLVPGGSEDGNAATDTRVVCDKLGNCATAGPIAGNKIDRKNPAATITTPPNGAVYQLNRSVTASFSCVDDGSGIGSCVGTAANGAPIDTASVGSKTFVVTATDTVGNTSSATVSYTVASNAISINNIPAQASAGQSFTPAYTYAGDGATSVTSSTTQICSVSGGVVSFLKVGTCTLVAHATATATFDAATGAPQSFTVSKRTPTISITNIPSRALVGLGFVPTYAYDGDGNKKVKSLTPAVCKVELDTVVVFVKEGTCTVQASATATNKVNAATGSPQSFTVAKWTVADLLQLLEWLRWLATQFRL